ncbi:hypothetical protein ACWFRQ_17825 [Streptomyces niveus]
MIAALVLVLIVGATVFVTAGALPALLLLAAALALAAAGLLLVLLLLGVAGAYARWQDRTAHHAAPRPVLGWAVAWRIAARLRTSARPPAHAAPSPRVRPETGLAGGSYRYRYHRKGTP